MYWNLRNDYLDAVPHQVRQTGGDQSILRRNQFGFNVSGPLVIPGLYRGGSRTFFSISYEGMREASGQHELDTIATFAERSGDFSQTVDSGGAFLPIYDPGTTRPNPNYDATLPVSQGNLQYLRDPFPQNVINPNRLDPVALGKLQYYPTPNVAIGPYAQNNYSIYSPEVNRADGVRARLDHTISEQHRFSFEMEYSNGLELPAKVIDSIANPGQPDREFRTRRGVVEHVFTISPSVVNTARLFVFRNVSENDAGVDTAGHAFPSLSFSPYLSMGRGSPVSWRAYTNYAFSDGLSVHLGKHRLKLSATVEREREYAYEPRYPSGRFRFSAGLTSLPGIVNTGHGFASFLLGMAEYAEASVVGHPSYFQGSWYLFSLNDEWEVRPGLSISIGAGFNVNTPRVEKYDRQSTVALDEINPENGRPGALIFAGRNGYSRGFRPTAVPPRFSLGVAWSPRGDSRTVIRASVSRSYQAPGFPRGQWGTQGFNGTPTFITQNAQLEPAVILRDGLPDAARSLPDLRPEAANGTNADLLDRSGALPVSDYLRLSVERQLPQSLVLSVGGSFARGRNQYADDGGANPNAIPLEALKYRDQLNDEEFNRLLRPYPQYQRFEIFRWPVGRYKRREMSVNVEKRTSEGLSLRFSYEFSKQMDDYNGRRGLQDYYNRENEWALSGYNRSHRISLNYMYELPFGPSKPFLNATDWRRYFVEGWMISGITSFSAGEPIQLRARFNNTGGVVDELYVNDVPGVDPHVDDPSPHLWFNPAAFVNPDDFTIGNAPRTHPTLRAPSSQNHDLSLTKRMSLSQEQSLEFIATALNFVNHANWNDPDSRIGTADAPNTNAGRITGSRGGRVLQLGLRVTF